MKALFKHIIYFLIISLSIVLLGACEKVTLEKVKVEGDIKFATDIIPIFTDNCISCHNGSNKTIPDLRADKAHASLFKYNCIDTIAPESSELYIKLTNTSGSHGTLLNDLQIGKIKRWIELGAKNN